MSWTLPTPLVLVAGGVALVPLADLLRGDGKATPSRPVSGLRLFNEAVITTLVLIAAAQLTWAALLWFEERRRAR